MAVTVLLWRPMTATLSGWTVTANPSTDNGGVYGSWNPYGGIDNTVTNVPATLAISTPTIRARCLAGATNMFFYYPGEQLTGSIGSQVAQTGASLTLTTTGISATAVSGTTYTASIYYANLANTGSNNGPNVTLNILAGGVVVGTGSVTGLAPGSPWTQVTATWTATVLTLGQAIQLQVVANNFLEGTQRVADAYFWIDPRHFDGHGQRAAAANGDQRRGGQRILDCGSLAADTRFPSAAARNCCPCREADINQIKVTFNENVIVDQSDLLLTGVNVPSYNVAGGTFSYNSTTFTATWTLPQSIGADKLMLALNANGSDPIRDAAGNRLDGEWTNPDEHDAVQFEQRYPSGNGTAGGNFDFRFNVLAGDANQDGTVNVGDLAALAAHWQQTGQGWAQGDFNGDGQVNVRIWPRCRRTGKGPPCRAGRADNRFIAAVVLAAAAAQRSRDTAAAPLMVDASTAPQGSPQSLTDAAIDAQSSRRPNVGGRLRTVPRSLAAMAGVKVQLPICRPECWARRWARPC